MRFLKRSLRSAFLLCVLGCLSTSTAIAQPWHALGRPPVITPLCVFFLNNQLGFVGGFSPLGPNGIVYTRNTGKSWIGSITPKGATNYSVYCIRTFDRRALYASVSIANTITYLWKSLDSGVSWTVDSAQQQPVTSSRPCYDIYLDVRGVPTLLPDVLGSTISRFDRAHYILGYDDGSGPPYYSIDSAVSWQQGTSPDPIVHGFQGFGAYADTVSGIGYAIGEYTRPILEATTDMGKTWFVQSLKLPGGFQVDDLEGENDHLYVQTDIGISRSDDGGRTWANLGGPTLTFDDRRFCVLGCVGLCVVAFDSAGGVWMMGDHDARTAPVLPYAIQDFPPPCDSGGKLVVRFASVRPAVRVDLGLLADTLQQFTLIGGTNITITDTGTVVVIKYNFKDLNSHRAYLSIIAPDSSVCSNATIPLTIPARTISWAIDAPPLIGACNSLRFPITIKNPNCNRLELKIVQVTSGQGGMLKPLAFDSIVQPASNDSLPFFFVPPGTISTGRYTVHIQGYLEPLHMLLDTIITVTISSSHVPSQLLAQTSITDFGTLQACTSFDTLLHFRNTGCDTLQVALDQIGVPPQWTVTPKTGTVTVLPGDQLDIQVHLDASKGGMYFLRLKYPYTGGTMPDVATMDITSTVLRPKVTFTMSSTGADFGSRNLCSPDSIATVLISNTSCDTLHFTSSLSQGLQGFSLLDATDTFIPPGGAMRRHFRFSSLVKGKQNGSALFHASLADGVNGRDTAIALSVEVIRASAILKASRGAIDFGTLATCQETDSSLVLQNVGCDTVCVSAISLGGTGFQFLTGSNSSVCIPPGGKQVVGIATKLDSSLGQAKNVATITVTSNADLPLVPITLTRTILYPTNWHLLFKAQQPTSAPQPVLIDILEQGSLPNDATSVDFTISYNADLLDYRSVDQPNVVIGAAMRTADGLAHQSIHVSPLIAGASLATLHFNTFVAPSNSTSFAITGMQINTTTNRSQSCVANVTLDSSAVSLVQLCGDPEQQKLMRGLPIVFDEVSPNPASSELRIRYSSGIETQAQLVIEDVLGRRVFEESEALTVGSFERTINLMKFPSGFYDLRVVSSRGSVVRRFVKE